MYLLMVQGAYAGLCFRRHTKPSHIFEQNLRDCKLPIVDGTARLTPFFLLYLLLEVYLIVLPAEALAKFANKENVKRRR